MLLTDRQVSPCTRSMPGGISPALRADTSKGLVTSELGLIVGYAEEGQPQEGIGGKVGSVDREVRALSVEC